jgi:hypothetical protein
LVDPPPKTAPTQKSKSFLVLCFKEEQRFFLKKEAKTFAYWLILKHHGAFSV